MRNHYNAIFLMCANKENKFSLTPCPFSFKELWLFGIPTPLPKLLVLREEVGGDQIHTKANPDIHTCLQFLIGFL